MMAESVPGSVIGDTRTSLPFGKLERGNRNEKRRGAGCDRIGKAAAHELDERVSVELLKRTLIAWINLPIAIVGEALLDHAKFGGSQRELRRHGRRSHLRAAMDREWNSLFWGGFGAARGHGS